LFAFFLRFGYKTDLILRPLCLVVLLFLD
jgi:hypothetical protein